MRGMKFFIPVIAALFLLGMGNPPASVDNGKCGQGKCGAQQQAPKSAAKCGDGSREGAKCGDVQKSGKCGHKDAPKSKNSSSNAAKCGQGKCG